MRRGSDESLNISLFLAAFNLQNFEAEALVPIQGAESRVAKDDELPIMLLGLSYDERLSNKQNVSGYYAGACQ